MDEIRVEHVNVDDENIDIIIDKVLDYVCERKLAVNDGSVLRKMIATICEEKDKREIQ